MQKWCQKLYEKSPILIHKGQKGHKTIENLLPCGHMVYTKMPFKSLAMAMQPHGQIAYAIA